MPHGYCYMWNPAILSLHVISDGLIGLSYFCIPVALVYLLWRRRDLPFHWMFLMFGAFIVSCGSTHLMEIWTVWHASYLASGMLKAITAGVSVLTTVMLVALLPKLIALPSPERLRAMNQELHRKMADRSQAERDLREALAERQRTVDELTRRQSSIDDLRVVEAALQQSLSARKQTLKELADQKFALDEHAIVAFTDVQGTITYVNEKFCSISQYSNDELIGQNHRILNSGHHSKDFFRHMYHTIANGKVWHGDIRNRAKDGSTYWVATTIVPTLDPDGKPEQYVAIRADITERMTAEASFREQQKELARSNRDLEQFAYAASHDLQEPLRAVAGSVQLLQARYQDKIDERANEFIVHAVDGATRMQQLIEDLLSFSRVGSQGGELKPVACKQVLEGALKNLSTSIQESQAQIAHDALPLISGDLGQLTLLFQNLIGNAIKFRGAERPYIQIGAELEGTEWVFSVCDNGIGIGPEYFERIFVIFQRLHTRREYPGTGMGLALCKKIVERHGGRIWVESQLGNGTTFRFSLRGLEYSETQASPRHDENPSGERSLWQKTMAT